MAITNTIFLKGLLGVGACLGAAGTAIANRGKIVSYFSKDKGKDKKAESDKKTAGGVAVNGTPTTTGTTEGGQAQENKDSGGGKTANGKGSKAPSQATPGGAGANTGQAKTTGPGADTTTGQGVGSTGGQVTQGQPGTSGPSQSAQTNTGHEEINKKIGDLKLPDGCKFDSSVKDNTKECSVTTDKLKEINFLGKPSDEKSLTVEGTSNNLKLVIKKIEDKDKGKYGTKGDLIFTFKDFENDLTVKNGNSTVVTLKKGTNPEFEIYSSSDGSNNKLWKSWYPSNLGYKVGLICPYLEGKCKPSSDSSKNIKIFDSSTQEIKELKVSSGDKTKEIFEISKDQENYNQGYKFSVSTAITGDASSGSLAENDNYEIKYLDNKGWALSKVTTPK